MADLLRVLSAPIPLTGRMDMATAAVLATADGLARSGRAAGGAVDLRTALVTSCAASRHQLERELTREGLDRASAGKMAVVERWHEFVAAGLDTTEGLLEDVGFDGGIDVLDSPDLVRAARTAFVRLYEEGRLRRGDEVVATCPRCETIVELSATNAGVNEAARLTLRLILEDEPAVSIDVEIIAAELLPGVAAVVVPDGHPASGGKVEVPIADRYVPVLAGAVDGPQFLIPGHDGRDWEMARTLGVSPIEVLDGDGVVRAAGPLDGLSRFAAREAAARMLENSGLVTHVEPAEEATWICPVCATPSIPRLTRHWFLGLAELEIAAADALREGVVVFHPPAAGQQVVAGAGERGTWCLSSRAWTGLQVPVSTCLDCGRLSVGVDLDDSCPTCMGALVPDEEVLDADFVAALWPLAADGWPARRDADGDRVVTVLVSGSGDVETWARPAAALGLTLTGSVPFGHLVVVPDDAAGEAGREDVAATVARDGRTLIRSRLAAAVEPVLAPLIESLGV